MILIQDALRPPQVEELLQMQTGDAQVAMPIRNNAQVAMPIRNNAQMAVPMLMSHAKMAVPMLADKGVLQVPILPGLSVRPQAAIPEQARNLITIN